jgi:hypothetical protein
MNKKKYQSPVINIKQLLIKSNILASATDPLLEDKGTWDEKWERQ